MEDSIQYSDRMLTEAEAALDRIQTLSGAATQVTGDEVYNAIEDEIHGVRSALAGAVSAMYKDMMQYLEDASVEVDTDRLRDFFNGLNILHGFLY